MALSSRPVLFIGLDGAEPELVRRWMADGTLRELAKLRDGGCFGPVRTLPGMGDGAVWPTLVTGVNPARHGRYFRFQRRPRSYRRFAFSVETDLLAEPFWMPLSRAGRRVAVLDVPYAPLPDDVNGVVLIDWCIHDRYGKPRSCPGDFVDEVLDRFGDDPVAGNSDKLRKDPETLEWAVDRLRERARLKGEMVTQTLKRASWDFLATVFTEPHDVGHIGWHLHDRHHRQHDADWVARHGDPIKSVYAAIDKSIGAITANADPEATIMVFAGLGMGPNYTANNILPRILDSFQGIAHREGRSLVKRVRASGGWRPLARVAGALDTVGRMYGQSRRRYFALAHNENSGAICINLKGREPLGRVPAAAFDGLCEELTEAFMEITNPANGEPIVEQVVRTKEEYRGAHADYLPDLFVVWSRRSPFYAVQSPRLGTIEGAKSWGRTGDHTPNAMLIVKGRDMAPGELEAQPAVVDIAASIGAMLGVPLPDVEGRAMSALGTCSTRSSTGSD